MSYDIVNGKIDRKVPVKDFVKHAEYSGLHAIEYAGRLYVCPLIRVNP